MCNKVKFLCIVTLLLFSIIPITGCTNQSFNDDIKLKDQYKEKYSNQFTERFELLTKLSVLLYNNSLENKYEDMKTLENYKSFINDYNNTNNKEQQEMVTNIKGFHDNYFWLVMDNALDQVVKDSVEKEN